eukprot:g12230.t1
MADAVGRAGGGCVHPGCPKQSKYGLEGAKAEYCSQHALPGMVDIYRPKCGRPGCAKYPSFGAEGMVGINRRREVYCKQHAKEGMVSLKEYCKQHAVEGMVDVRKMRDRVGSAENGASRGKRASPTRQVRILSDDTIGESSTGGSGDGGVKRARQADGTSAPVAVKVEDVLQQRGTIPTPALRHRAKPNGSAQV